MSKAFSCLVVAVVAGGCAKATASNTPTPVTAPAPVAAPPAETAKSRAAKAAVQGYNEVRAALAADNLNGTKSAAPPAGAKIAALKTDFPGDADAIAAMVAATDRIATAGDLKLARSVFGELSRSLIGVVASDAASQVGVVCYRCPMTKTYQKWLQVGDAMGNPYFGAEMLTCGAKVPIAP